MSKAGQDKIKDMIINKILEELEKGVVPWRCPWVKYGGAWNRKNGKPYGIINQFLLGGSGEYATMKQITEDGGTVLKGAKSKYVVGWFYKLRERKDANGEPLLDENGEPETYRSWYMKYYKVFNIETDTTLEPKKVLKSYDGEPIENCERVMNDYLSREKIKLSHNDKDRAYYSPSLDVVNLPLLEQFKSVPEYYSTAFHELAHSTGHKCRLDRLSTDAHFGSHDYGVEELVAELTSAMILNTLGVETQGTLENSASYIDNWTKAIKENKDMIISAGTYSDKAYEMIMNL